MTTTRSKGLTPAQLEQYERDGFVVVDDLFTDAELETFIDRWNDISFRRVPVPRDMLAMKDVMVAKKIVKLEDKPPIAKLQFFQSDPVLRKYLTHERLLDHVESICGPNIKMIHNMLISKPPGLVDPEVGKVTGGRHPLHQDLLYFTDRPPERITATWVALQDVNRENGCLSVIPGSHRTKDGKGVLYEHCRPSWKYVNSAYWGVKDLPKDFKSKLVHLEMKKGQTVFFHPLLLHGSGRNRSDDYRRCISAHYADIDCDIVEEIPHDVTNMFAALGNDMLKKIRGHPAIGLLACLLGLMIGFLAIGWRDAHGRLQAVAGVGMCMGMAIYILIKHVPAPGQAMGRYLFRYGTRKNHLIVRGKSQLGRKHKQA
eukprot:TRINITY_DN18729_c0_g1_i1.p1 TRINITY_DN18729_c0_g1~~TRINITY_DN18729_c0_g1_i1.p1  ORF type:complete len:371 (-),score=45.14 TRINITY_DN18729_c0_g1_i1:139-1251(-)